MNLNNPDFASGASAARYKLRTAFAEMGIDVTLLEVAQILFEHPFRSNTALTSFVDSKDKDLVLNIGLSLAGWVPKQKTQKKITIRTADALFRKFIAGVDAANANTQLPYFVERIVLFGSYLCRADQVTDIDLRCISYVRKTSAKLDRTIRRYVRQNLVDATEAYNLSLGEMSSAVEGSHSPEGIMTKIEWRRLEKLLAEYDVSKDRELFEGLVTENVPISSWGDFLRWFSLFPQGSCFRGQRDASWPLVATLDRKLWKRTEVDVRGFHSTSFGPLNVEENEKSLLLDFQRGAHHYQEKTPPIDYTVDWLAMMQHYGAPTRLLDWTRSPYVALYFALQGDSSGDSMIWAIDLKWLQERSDTLLRKHHADFPTDLNFDTRFDYINRAVISYKNEHPIIVPVTPRQLNQRMIVQQGELLYNLSDWIPFSTSLLGMLIHPTNAVSQVVGRAIVKRDQRVEFLRELRRMNIHDASLFPGLDGFARSLGVNLDISLMEQVAAKEKADPKKIKALQKRRKAKSSR